MDLASFQGVLLHTFSRDQAERAEAEKQLDALKAIPGFHLLLLHTITQPLPREIRQAAAIALKNSAKRTWELADRCVAEGKPIAPQAVREEEKVQIRAKALEGLINEADPKVRVLLAETVHSLLIFDYPDRWPEFIETAMCAVHSGSPLFLHNALLALRKLTKKYEFKPKKDREAFEAAVVAIFPTLHQLAKSLIGENSLEAADILRLVLKVFWSSTQFALPTGMTDDALLSWMELLGHVLSKDLPEPTDPAHPPNMPRQPTDPEERKRWPWWKAKKWACMIIERFYARYGVPRYADEARMNFAQTFHQRVAPALLSPMLALLTLRSNGRFCTDRVVYMSLRFVSTGIEMAPTFTLLKPNLDYLLFHVVFPLLCLKDEDVELFDHDPHEYIRKMQGVGESTEEMYYDPREEALTLIKGAVTKRSKTALPKMLTFLHNMLTQYQASAPQQRNYRHKDAVLQCLGALNELMKKRKELRGQLQLLIATHVLPEFTSPQGFMRARACWMMRHYADVEMEKPLLAQVVAAVLNCLCDRCLPVQVEAATAIRELAVIEGVEPLIVPHLEELLRQYFRLMNEVGSDEVVQALDMLIGEYSEHMAPHAHAMASQLHAIFRQYVAEAEQDDEKALAATQCLEALNSLVQACRAHPDVLRSMEAEIVPVLALVLGPEGEFYEYLENALDLLTCVTYYTEPISTDVWLLFPLLYGAFDRWASDYLENMVDAVDNYIHRSTEVFITGTTAEGTRFVDLALRMAGRMIADPQAPKIESARACAILKSILHSCKGRVNEYLPPLLEMVVNRMAITKGKGSNTRRLMIALLEVVASCIHYDPQLALQTLEAHGWTMSVFTFWFDHLDYFTGRFAKKQATLGLSSLLLLPAHSLPECLRSNLLLIISRTTAMLHQIVEEDEAPIQLAEARDDGGDEEAEADVEDDEDYVDKDDEHYHAALKRMQQREERKGMASGGVDDDDDDSGDDPLDMMYNGLEVDDEEEDASFESPLHMIDEVIFFSNALTLASQREPQVIQEVTGAMAPELNQQLVRVMEAGVRRREEEEEDAREEARLNGQDSATPAALAPNLNPGAFAAM